MRIAKNAVRINESQLRQIVRDQVNIVLNEIKMERVRSASQKMCRLGQKERAQRLHDMSSKNLYTSYSGGISIEMDMDRICVSMFNSPRDFKFYFDMEDWIDDRPPRFDDMKAVRILSNAIANECGKECVWSDKNCYIA